MVQQEDVRPVKRTADLAVIGPELSDDLAVELRPFILNLTARYIARTVVRMKGVILGLRRTELCHDT